MLMVFTLFSAIDISVNALKVFSFVTFPRTGTAVAVGADFTFVIKNNNICRNESTVPIIPTASYLLELASIDTGQGMHDVGAVVKLCYTHLGWSV